MHSQQKTSRLHHVNKIHYLFDPFIVERHAFLLALGLFIDILCNDGYIILCLSHRTPLQFDLAHDVVTELHF